MLSRGIVKAARNVFDIQKVLKGNIEALTTEECVSYWGILDLLEKKIMKPRKSELRKKLLGLVKELGEKDKKGHKVLKLGDIYAEVKREIRGGKVTYIMAMAQQYVEQCKDKDPMVSALVKMEPVIDEAVLLSLREREIMSEKEFDQIVSVGDDVEVLKVKAPKDIRDLVEDL